MTFIKICLFVFCLLVPTFMVHAGDEASFYMMEKNILVDQKGRHVMIEKSFNRIISLYGAHTENLFYLGLDPEIIGVTQADKYPEKAVGKKIFSQGDDPEKYLVEKPDLVLIRPMLDRGYARLFDRLEKSGITIVSLQPKNIEDMFKYWEILGVLTGRKNQAELMIKRFKQSVAEYQMITNDVTQKPRVYFEAIHTKMKTFTRGAMADFVLTASGGINVAADGSPSRGTNIAIYGKERILSKSSQIDVFISQRGSMNRVTRETIKNEPGFHIIKAVQDNRIFIVDEKIVSRPTMRLLYGISEIGAYLYPDLFKGKAQKILKETFGPK
ncbi:MAG: ABC transporter substrate-binding protein [Desulfobacteraceae bacterium]|nr:ABC transporter substrate-binding protein [Desulfobacteraceae bacterium]